MDNTFDDIFIGSNISNFQYEEDEEIGLSDSDKEDNSKLNNLEQLTSHHHHIQSKDEPIMIGLLVSLLDLKLEILSN
ncbi:3636_t:CDS:2 [Funneliformis mosseae]|uniref:3636_t:CDS:1 n=1 Tax=Funneliformis mosseae TaxID=27381 RepID=A0A9N9GEW3_FUNMO|nr:3636_t:CDS:2 [Funneliformis mosseae]